MRKVFIPICFLIILFLFAGCKKEEYVHVGSNWDALYNLSPEKGSFKVHVSGSKSAETGEELEYTIRSDKTGKLWIVQVDPNDNVSMVYPNSMATDNRIRAGQSVKIPPENAEWSIRAEKPLGKSILAFVVTTGNTTVADIFNNPQSKEPNMEKAIRVISNSEWGIDKMVVDID